MTRHAVEETYTPGAFRFVETPAGDALVQQARAAFVAAATLAQSAPTNPHYATLAQQSAATLERVCDRYEAARRKLARITAGGGR
jgi:hypothetical protein